MRYLLVLLIGGFQGFAQPNVHIQGRFEGFPSSQYQIFVKTPFSLPMQEPVCKARTDAEGGFKADLRLESPQRVTVECLGYAVDFLLKPNDTLYFRNPSRSLCPIVQGPTACLHRFLYENLLFGKDSLIQKPLFKHMASEDYSFVVNDLCIQAWERFQRDCDTNSLYINTFVTASLEGQKFFRKQAHLQIQGETAKSEPIRLKMLGDEAIISDIYLNALQSQWFGYYTMGAVVVTGSNGSFTADSTLWERRYNSIYEDLRKFPKTREMLLAQTVRRSFLVFPYALEKEKVPTQLLERFKEDFPRSPHIKELETEGTELLKRMRRIAQPKK